MDQEKINQLISFLNAFKNETDKLQQENQPSVHLVLLSYCRLLKHCKHLDTDTHEVKGLKTKAEHLIKEKFKPQLVHKIATFLWPPFKHLKMLTEEERQEVI